MSERWKYQFKIGTFWGFFMTLFNVLFELREKPLATQLSHPGIYVKALIYILGGIFVLGYFNWKGKVKNESGN